MVSMVRFAWLGLLALVLGVALPHPATAQEYGAQYTPPAPPRQGYTPGATVNVQVTVRNTGTLAWNRTPDAQGRYFVLGYHWQGPETTHAAVPQPGALSMDVPSNGVTTVTVQLQVPATPGTYTLQWDMVHLGQTWFTGCCGVIGVDAPNPGAVQTVGVGGPGIFQLCQIVECAKPTAATLAPGATVAICPAGPHIAGWVPFSGMRQGGVVALHGKCFGQPGTLRLKGLPGGDVTLTDVVEWKPKVVAVSIPMNLAVPGDTPVTLEVTRADGKKATSPPITFIPLRVLKKVPRSAVAVNICGGALTDCNHCNDTIVNLSTGSLNFCQFVPITDATIRGYHLGDCIFGCTHPGTDSYHITLKNDHRFHSAAWSEVVSAVGEANAGGGQATSAHVQGKTSVRIDVPFWVTGWDWVRYNIDLLAEGPINVTGGW
jgi:hypothetical protein